MRIWNVAKHKLTLQGSNLILSVGETSPKHAANLDGVKIGEEESHLQRRKTFISMFLLATNLINGNS